MTSFSCTTYFFSCGVLYGTLNIILSQHFYLFCGWVSNFSQVLWNPRVAYSNQRVFWTVWSKFSVWQVELEQKSRSLHKDITKHVWISTSVLSFWFYIVHCSVFVFCLPIIYMKNFSGLVESWLCCKIALTEQTRKDGEENILSWFI